jgi:hypothetical protein
MPGRNRRRDEEGKNEQQSESHQYTSPAATQRVDPRHFSKGQLGAARSLIIVFPGIAASKTPRGRWKPAPMATTIKKGAFLVDLTFGRTRAISTACCCPAV